jgi:hypothetical protein
MTVQFQGTTTTSMWQEAGQWILLRPRQDQPIRADGRRAFSRMPNAMPSFLLSSRRRGASRWRSGPTTRSNGDSGSQTCAPAMRDPFIETLVACAMLQPIVCFIGYHAAVAAFPAAQRRLPRFPAHCSPSPTVAGNLWRAKHGSLALLRGAPLPASELLSHHPA